jgi:hypothetical protein
VQTQPMSVTDQPTSAPVERWFPFQPLGERISRDDPDIVG